MSSDPPDLGQTHTSDTARGRGGYAIYTSEKLQLLLANNPDESAMKTAHTDKNTITITQDIRKLAGHLGIATEDLKVKARKNGVDVRVGQIVITVRVA